MNTYGYTKVIAALFFAFLLILVLLFSLRQAAKIGAPAPVIVKMNGGGLIEIESPLK